MNSYLSYKLQYRQNRKTFFLLIGLVLILFSQCVSLYSASSDWTGFRGNPQLTGVAATELPDALELLWTFQAADMIEGTAAVVKGIVYVGALDGYLYAIDARNGELQWKYQAGESDSPVSIKASPAVYNGVIYVGDGEGVFHAIEVNAGKQKWKFQSDGEIFSSANFGGANVLFGSYDGFLYCLNRESGALVWKFETEGYIHGTPAIFGNSVVITGCDSYLRVINIGDGSQTQQVYLGAYVGASPAILENRAYAGTYGTEVLGVELGTGNIAWRYQHPKRRFPFFASAAVTEDVVIIGGRDKMLHALSPDTGAPQWIYTAKSRIESSAVIVGKRVFFGTTRGVLIALDISNGEPVWEFETGSAIVASPSVANGQLYIGTESGTLYCFGEKNNP